MGSDKSAQVSVISIYFGVTRSVNPSIHKVIKIANCILSTFCSGLWTLGYKDKAQQFCDGHESSLN